MVIELPTDKNTRPQIVDLWNPALDLNTDPLAAACGCMACTRHTRGYLHHMLRVHEMNAGQLAYEHNLFVVQIILRRAERMAARDEILSRQSIVEELLHGKLV